MKVSGLALFFMCFLSIHCLSQKAANDSLPSSSTTPANPYPPSDHSKMHVNFTAGTEFWSASGYGSGMGTLFTAGITYPVAKRFNLGGGIGIMNTTPIATHNTFYEGFGNANFTNTLIYVTGEYLLSQRITVSGILFKEFNMFNTSPEYQHFQKNTPQGAYMKVSYKINDVMQIEAGFGYSKGVNSYYNSFTGSPYSRPFPFTNP